jgi:AcrR family transcriptional regulator
MDWERARSDEQIEYRINEIMEATARLYARHRFEDITFSMIAKEANFTRSNLYRYFENKEDIFLELLSHDLENWQNNVLERFTDEEIQISEFSRAWIDLILEEKRMMKLLTILFTMIEQNASVESLTKFKARIMQNIGTVAIHLSKVFPFESVEKAAEYLTAQTSLIIGIYPSLHMTDKQKAAIEAIGLDHDPDHYSGILLEATEILLEGYIKKSD